VPRPASSTIRALRPSSAANTCSFLGGGSLRARIECLCSNVAIVSETLLAKTTASRPATCATLCPIYRIFTSPTRQQIDDEATGWAALLTDTLMRRGNGNIGSDDIANGSITTAAVGGTRGEPRGKRLTRLALRGYVDQHERRAGSCSRPSACR
jgi:hypothetical protein